MLSLLLMMTSVVGGFAYRTDVSERIKPVKSAPAGYARKWKEHVETIVAVERRDADFTRLMWQQASRMRRGYYEGVDECPSFDKCRNAGSLDVGQAVLAASPDIVSVNAGVGFYIAGMAHPNAQGSRSFIWSRRLHRLLTQRDVLAVPPDRALRRIAQANFDNRENLQNPDDPNGIPLSWDHASIGPDGITWSFEPYELGGYLSAGDATVGWAELKPYLRAKLPFVINKIRKPSGQDTRGR